MALPRRGFGTLSHFSYLRMPHVARELRVEYAVLRYSISGQKKKKSFITCFSEKINQFRYVSAGQY